MFKCKVLVGNTCNSEIIGTVTYQYTHAYCPVRSVFRLPFARNSFN